MSQASTEAEADVILGSGTILLIDDDQSMRIMGKAMLENLGYQVRLATDGAEGLALFRSLREQIDLVIVDMMMPVMNGRECFDKIRAIDPEATVILASGFCNDEDLISMTRAGLKGFVQKPYFNSVLSQAVNAALQNKRSKTTAVKVRTFSQDPHRPE
jgi:CheY-like chemotaxis protein